MKHLGLFEGIGGFSLAARWMGWETLAWCEWNEFGQKVLRHHFPEAEGFGDIKKTDFTKYANKIDIITGGFPCQPYSTAGKRKGKEDERHLWPEMLRAIREVQPSYVVGENVRGIVTWNGGLVFDEVQADLEAEGYEVLPFLLPACSKDAPHQRDRIWFVAHSESRENNRRGQGRLHAEPARINDEGITANPDNFRGWSESQSSSGNRTGSWDKFDWENSANDANTYDQRLQGSKDNGSIKRSWPNGHEQSAGLLRAKWEHFPTKPAICGGNDGLSRELDNITFSKWRTESIKAYGNAIVPQIAYELFKAIEATDNLFNKEQNLP